MKILVINAGSSSLKYQLIDTDNEAVSQRVTVKESVRTVLSLVLKRPTAKKSTAKHRCLITLRLLRLLKMHS